MISNFHAIIFQHHQIFQEVTASHAEKKGYSLVNAHCLQKIQACRCVVQDCRKKSNPRIGISLHTSKSIFELAKRKSFVRSDSSNFNPRGLFKIDSVHFESDGFERTVHLEGAPRRPIREFKSSENVAQNCKFKFIKLFRHYSYVSLFNF